MVSGKNIFSIEPERVVLSLILNNPDLIYSAGIDGLRYYMFSSSQYMSIYKSIEELKAKSLSPEPSLLISHMESTGVLKEAGGTKAIELLMSLEGDPGNFAEYVDLTVRQHKARSFVSLASDINAEKITVDKVDDYIREFKNNLDNLSSSTGGSSTIHVGDKLKEVLDRIVARINDKGFSGLSWGIQPVDVGTGGKLPGDLWIVGGRPGQGKTALLLNSMMSDGENNIPTLIFEKEMTYDALVERLVSIVTGISIQQIRLGTLNKPQVNQITEAMRKIKSFPLYVDTNFRADVSYIEDTILRYVSTKGVKVVYVDYLQLIAERGDNQTAELGRISRMLKLLATNLNITILSASQLNRMVEAREDKRPILSDLRQSGNLEEDADYAIGLYRDEYYNSNTKHNNRMEFIILKARNGPVGTINLKFTPETNKIEAL